MMLRIFRYITQIAAVALLPRNDRVTSLRGSKATAAICLSNSPRFSKQSGHAALYALLLLPVAVALSTLGLEVSSWNDSRESIQNQVLTIANQAASYLPNTTRARDSLTQSFSNLPEDIKGVVTLVTNEEINLDILSNNTGDNSNFTLKRSIQIKKVPTDVVMVLVDGNTLRPPRSADFDVWGDSFNWPEADILNCKETNNYQSAPWSNTNFQRWVTQACFNPVLNQYKEAAILIARNLSSYQSNRISLIFTPGGNNFSNYEIVRSLRASYTSPGGLLKNNAAAEALLPASGGEDFFVRSDLCAAFSNPLLSSRYNIQNVHNQNSNSNCDLLTINSFCGGTFDPLESVQSCYQENYLTLEQAILWNHAKEGVTKIPDLAASLQAALAEFGRGSTQATKDERGNLSVKAQKIIVALTDFLPEVNSTQINELLQATATQKIKIILVSFSHQGLSTSQRSTLRSRFSEWQNKRDSYNLTMLEASSADEINQRFVKTINSIGAKYAIQSY